MYLTYQEYANSLTNRSWNKQKRDQECIRQETSRNKKYTNKNIATEGKNLQIGTLMKWEVKNISLQRNIEIIKSD